VTFLYYLGRFNLSNNHFLRAANCLEGAYLQTPPALSSHRTRILSFLIPCNLLLGRLPSAHLLARPEAKPLVPIFTPLAQAIRTGNFIYLQHALATHETWLFDRGLLLVLSHRLRPFLWRALSRRTFLLTYVPPEQESRRAATLDLTDLHIAAEYIQRRLEGWVPAVPTPRSRPPHVNSIFMKAVSNNVSPNDSPSTLVPPPGGPKVLRPNEGLVWGNAPVTAQDIEMVVATLIQQGLLHGYIAHGQGKMAIIGAKQKGSPVLAGWPNVWQAIQERRYEDDLDLDDVPGWVKG
jgi:nuclear mRNA export protein PCID2/THP1